MEVEHSLAVLGFTGRGREGSLANQKALFSMQEEEEGLSCFPSRQTAAQTPRGREDREDLAQKKSQISSSHTLSLSRTVGPARPVGE